MYDSANSAPRFKSSIEPIVDPDDGLYLFSEQGHVSLTGRIYCDLAPLLDGTHQVEDIFERMCRHHASADVLAALDLLKRHGFLAEGTSSKPRDQLAFWDLAGTNAMRAAERMLATPVDIMCLGKNSTQDLQNLLEQNGLRVVDHGALRVVVTDSYLAPELDEWNRQAIAEGKPWVLVKPGGIQSWLGPAFVPGETACWECLAHRLRWHKRAEVHFAHRAQRRDGFPHVPISGIGSSALPALAELATEVTRWIGVGGSSVLADRVISTDRLTLERQSHVLTRRPQCPACGEANRQAHSYRLDLKSRPKLRGTDGGHRSTEASKVLKTLDRHVSPITGIIGTVKPGTRSGPVKGEDWVTPTYSADHNFSDMHDSRFFLREGLRRRSGGKGRTPEQASISAVAESLERYSGVFDGTEPRQMARFVDLEGHAIAPNDCMSYSPRQFANRETSNLKDHKAHWVPEPFDPEAEIEWTPLWSLGTESIRYLPTSMCYFGYQGTGPIFGRADSNGCAAGATIEDAILQGLLELVERDAVAIWWYNRLVRPGVKLDGYGDTYAARMMARYSQLNRTLDVIDVTSDIGIPTFAAISGRTDKAEQDIIYGFGCHLDPETALSRALTEVNQSLEAVPKTGGSAGQMTYLGSSESVNWWRTVTLKNSPYLTPDAGSGWVSMNDHRSLARDDVLTDIETCISLLGARGIDVLVLDQTRPDVGFPVVRVVAPGLRHFWARFGPGRLYDIPVQQGWLETQKPEENLNPHIIQF